MSGDKYSLGNAIRVILVYIHYSFSLINATFQVSTTHVDHTVIGRKLSEAEKG